MNLRFPLGVLPLLLPLFLLPRAGRSDNEIGFIEKFALAADRERVLEQLIPGSEEYYFYHALQDQNTGQKEKLKAILEQWAARFPQSAQRRMIENREALLHYDVDPKATLEFLRTRLNLQFNHQQEARDQKPNLPAALDPARISRKAFQDHAVALAPDDLGQLQEGALEELVRSGAPLNPPQRRALLARLSRPDLPHLLEVIAADLATRESKGFGEYPIHRLLLSAQLDDLAQSVPSLYESQEFVRTRLVRLLPNADVALASDPAEHEAWLERVWKYVKNLSPSFNSLKAHTLFQRLVLDRTRGIYDKARFLEYLKLPRPAPYMNPRYLEKGENAGHLVDFNADFARVLIAPPIQSDEWLVRDYLLHLLPAEAGWEPYGAWLREEYLKPLFAEAKIVNGVGDPEKWAALLSPAEFKALKERVDLEFSPANTPVFLPKDEVSLTVAVKNAPKIIVRLYELNTLTFFLTQQRQLNTDLNLDGLVANAERTHSFPEAGGESPFRRTERSFDFPELRGKRGAWIIEFIGGGKSSRALVRKGQWEALQTAGPAGDLIEVVDEAHQPVPEAVVWLEGRRFAPNPKLGRIVIPFTNQPGQKPLILASAAGDFASLGSFEHHGEQYRLDAQFHIEREQLLAGRQATLAIRTALLVGDQQIPPELILEPKLTITSKTLNGVATTREITAAQGLALKSSEVTTHVLAVPDRLAELTVTLTGKVEKLVAGGEKIDVSASHTWSLNGIDRTEATYDGHLTKGAQGYVFELLGKDAEPVPDQQILFQFTHHDFKAALPVALRTDEQGRIGLGELAGIASLSAHLPSNLERSWPLTGESAALRPQTLHEQAGTPLRVPWMGGPLRPEEVSLLEKREEGYVADRFGALSLEEGFLVIKGLPPGDYQLLLREGGERTAITIKLSGGAAVADWLLSPARHLRIQDPAPLQIQAVQVGEKALTVQLRNARSFARVHIVASRYLTGPEWRLGADLGGFVRANPAEGAPAHRPNLFVSGRAIGDEYRYILDRRYSHLFPGNMLARPGLLLNPWEVRSTDVSEQQLQQAEAQRRALGDAEGKPAAAAPPMAMPGAPSGPEAGKKAAEPDLDFFAAAAPAVYNLLPDKNGVVTLDRQALGDRHFVQVYAEDLQGAVWRSVALPEAATKLRDLRLIQNLDPQKAFVESRQVSVLAAGQKITIADLLRADLETYDSLGSIHALFSTLSGDANLAKFAFILRWPGLKPEEKRAKYSEFACHELNFFLSRKDPAFFQEVIAPYLANKKEKTFLDDYLLEGDLRRYLEPWAYQRLNMAERALLARRLPGEAAATARHLRDLWELSPPDVDRENFFFDSALFGRALGEEGGAAFKEEKAAAVALDGLTDHLGMRNGTLAAGADKAPAAAAALMKRSGAGAGGRPALAERKLAESESAGRHGAPRSDMERSGKDGVERARAEAFGLQLMDQDAAQALRGELRPFFRRIGPTREWAENNYYQLRITAQDASLIPIDGFWLDYAEWDGKAPFLSAHVAEASHNFSEMLLALAVLDLPFEAPRHQTHAENGQFTLTPGGPLLAFHKEIVDAPPAADQPELLISENFYRQDDRYRMEGNLRFDKYVAEEFLAGAVYGGNVVVTNPGSAPRTVELLVQIPRGSLPVLGSKATESKRLKLDPYTTQTFEYHFYFPEPSPADPFAHYPAHVSQEEHGAGAARPMAFKVVRKLSKIDTASWNYLSQYGSEEEVFAYLQKNNLERLDLARVAWRARQSADFFHRLLALLQARHVYSEVIYSYAVVHNDAAALREWLRHRDDFLAQCGPALVSPLLTIDPIERRAYEHLEYSPLINQRAHRLGAENHILNPVVRGQYQQLLEILSYEPKLAPMEEMSVVYYLFLQDRVEEALARFKTIAPAALPTRLQYDYFRVYAALYEEQLPAARGVASQYAKYPVDRWRKLFTDALAQIDEIAGQAAPAAPAVAAPKPDREAQQGELAATEPSFDFKVEDHHLAITYKNLQEVTVNYYLMDPEFLFSSSPFVSQDPSRFSIIKPGKSVPLALPAGQDALEAPLPAEYAKANVLIEMLGAGQRKAEAYHANSLKLTLTEPYGRLELRDSVAGQPVSKAYVKVYARLKNGQIRFYKDGYTDLRGKFDYASLNSGAEAPQERMLLNSVPQPVGAAVPPTSGFDYPMLRPKELGEVDRLSILILSEAHGAMVREAAPPSE